MITLTVGGAQLDAQLSERSIKKYCNSARLR